ncbi:uncharacterized protein TNCT_494181 [Trichonephila clavata]|uniref:Uncharacterized protein n=1 Tax=Trichonephila clavata TaxID=2740835 RepID=A0A8X6FQC3_TRICU|nr:uncharacterized protein TNCT_494181 [Trichonephila clavata]
MNIRSTSTTKITYKREGHVVGSEILFANRLAPPLRENNKHIQETIQLSTADDSLKDLGKIEVESQETKSVKYWAQKITYAFRSLTVPTKPRKNSFGSLFSSLGMFNLIQFACVCPSVTSCFMCGL